MPVAKKKRRGQKRGRKPGGRNKWQKFDAIKRAEFLEQLRKGSARCTAAEHVGVSYNTVMNAMHEGPDFASAVSAAEVVKWDTVEDAHVRTAKEGNVTAQLSILYNKKPNEWKDRRAIAMTGASGGPIQVQQEVIHLDIGAYWELLEQRAQRDLVGEQVANALNGPRPASGQGNGAPLPVPLG